MGCRKYFFFYLISHFLGYFLYNLQIKGSFENHVDMIFWFFHQPPSSVVIFYVLNMDKYGKILTKYPPTVVYITAGLNLQETLERMAKYHHIFDTFKHFWVARKPNSFDPSMIIGGAAISFFLLGILGWNLFWDTILWKKLVVRTFETMFCPKN